LKIVVGSIVLALHTVGMSIPGGSKAILRALGMAVGQPRLPLASLPPETQIQFEKDLKDIGFFEWAMQK
jgi:dihydrodipicolinate synthase/N-acetylneuraminate lyase